MIRVRGFQPLSVALVPHHDGRAHLTIVVKAAFAVPPPGESRAVPLPPPAFRGDEPVAWPGLGSAELAHASDLAPRKARADVTLSGHASSSSPETTLPIRFSVGPIRRELVAVASAPATDLPLVSEHLRAHPPSEPIVAPLRPVGARLRRPRRAGRAEAAWGASMIDLATAEDGSGYQIAPREQQLPIPFPSSAQVFLSGLGSGTGGAERWFWLPPAAPFAVVVAGGSVEAVPLLCDTVHVDVDAGVVTVLHRGRWSGAVSDLELLVGISGEGSPREPGEALARRSSSQPLSHTALGAAGEPIVVPAEADPASPADLSGFAADAGHTAALDIAHLVAPLPFGAPPAPAPPELQGPPTTPRDDDDDGGPATAMVDASLLGVSLPFAQPRADEPARRDEITAAIPVAHLAGFDEAPGETRPIAVAAPTAPATQPPPPSAAAAGPGPSSWPGGGGPAPFSAPFSAPSSVVGPAAPVPAAAPPLPAREVDSASTGRAPLTADELADLQVELASADRSERRAILSRHQLDPVAWAQESARWAAQLEAEAARGESRTLDTLLARARARRAELDEPAGPR